MSFPWKNGLKLGAVLGIKEEPPAEVHCTLSEVKYGGRSQQKGGHGELLQGNISSENVRLQLSHQRRLFGG